MKNYHYLNLSFSLLQFPLKLIMLPFFLLYLIFVFLSSQIFTGTFYVHPTLQIHLLNSFTWLLRSSLDNSISISLRNRQIAFCDQSVSLATPFRSCLHYKSFELSQSLSLSSRRRATNFLERRWSHPGITLLQL